MISSSFKLLLDKLTYFGDKIELINRMFAINEKIKNITISNTTTKKKNYFARKQNFFYFYYKFCSLESATNMISFSNIICLQ